MKIRYNWTKAMIGVAIIEIIVSIIWFTKYPDLSQLILYISGGILLIIFAYIYEWMKRFQGEIRDMKEENLKDRINIRSLQRWVTDKEKNDD